MRHIKRWRRLTAQRGEPGYRPFNQATHTDLTENPKSAPHAIHEGLSLGREPLLQCLGVWQDIGIDQLMINFKHSRRPVSEVMAELSEYVLPHFPAGNLQHEALPVSGEPLSMTQDNQPHLEEPPFRAYSAFMDHNIFKIDLVSDNEYTVRAEAEGQTVESLFRTDPDYLERIGLAEADRKRVVEETARFLAEHQPVIDFPPMIDLEDIAAAYEDFAQQLQKRLETR